MAKGIKTVTLVKHETGKGFMKALSLREDSKHALEQISSIMTLEDYEDLGNHSTKAMGELWLFAVTQVIMPVDLLSVHSHWLYI